MTATLRLRDLAHKYKANKYDDQFKGSGPVACYEELFGERRERVQKVLEIGLGYVGYNNEGFWNKSAPSLLMWEEYFPNALIFGLDISPEALINRGRIHSFQCDQSKPESIAAVLPLLGDDFDLIVDDGSHRTADQVLTAKMLLPQLHADGVYVIEDVHYDERDQLQSAIPYPSKFCEFYGPSGNLGELMLVIWPIVPS